MPIATTRRIDPWVDVITLGDARFGQLEGGPFDGRCFPLPEGVPAVLEVPAEGPVGGGSPPTVRYVLRDGRYRYVGSSRSQPAA
jgi:hypothetical protein